MGLFNKIKKRFPNVFKKVENLSKGIFSPIIKVFDKSVIPKVPQTHQDELLVANEAYVKPQNRKREIMGYKYDSDLSAKRWAIYVKDDTKQINLGFRGTIPTNIRDLGSDLKILIQDTFKSPIPTFKRSVYMKEAREVYKNVLSKYPGYDITITGHSLGGRVSLETAKEFNDNAVMFNAGGGDFSRNQIPKGSIHYRAPTDPISVGFATDPRTETIVDKSKKAGLNHSLTYFM